MNIIEQYEKLIKQSESLELSQLKKDLRQISYDDYILKLNYKAEKYVCTFTFMKDNEHLETFGNRKSAELRAATLGDELKKLLEQLVEINKDYDSLANMILVNKKPASKKVSNGIFNATDKDNVTKFAPALISTFDKYIKIGEKNNE